MALRCITRTQVLTLKGKSYHKHALIYLFIYGGTLGYERLPLRAIYVTSTKYLENLARYPSIRSSYEGHCSFFF